MEWSEFDEIDLFQLRYENKSRQWQHVKRSWWVQLQSCRDYKTSDAHTGFQSNCMRTEIYHWTACSKSLYSLQKSAHRNTNVLHYTLKTLAEWALIFKDKCSPRKDCTQTFWPRTLSSLNMSTLFLMLHSFFFVVKHSLPFFANKKLTEKPNYEELVFEIVWEKIEQEQKRPEKWKVLLAMQGAWMKRKAGQAVNSLTDRGENVCFIGS